jgi:hypothetical protein
MHLVLRRLYLAGQGLHAGGTCRPPRSGSAGSRRVLDWNLPLWPEFYLSHFLWLRNCVWPSMSALGL